MKSVVRVKLTAWESRCLETIAVLRGVSAETVVGGWIEEKLRAEVAERKIPSPEQAITSKPKCLCPSCSNSSFARGLCHRHYQRARYFMSKNLLSEGWLVRHGRLAPFQGRSVESYSTENDPLAFGKSESLATLPGALPDNMPETKWLFGWPEAMAERARLEGRPAPTPINAFAPPASPASPASGGVS